MNQYIYSFQQGNAEGKSSLSDLLGGKGANLAEMCNLNIPVPPGFTITTEVCNYFIKHNKYPPGFKKQIKAALNQIENILNQKFGDIKNPLLLSVRSGAKISMPGMMETILNIGLNNKTIPGLISNNNDKRFAFDSYRRLIMMFSDVVMDKSNNLNFGIRIKLENEINILKAENKIFNDIDLKDVHFQSLCVDFQKIINKTFNKAFPQNPYEQLWQSIDAVFKSWHGDRAIEYRKIENISNNLGTAVNIQAMVFGNLNNNSATGVAFTRNPSTGENVFFGEWLPNAQGEDVVAGIRTPYQINNTKNSLEIKNPIIYKQLFKIQKKLENHYSDMQDIEFTIQKNKLWLLQTRTGKRNGHAAIKIALDFLKLRKIDYKEFLHRIKPNHITELLYPIININDEKKKQSVGQGLPAGPGCAVGQIVFNPDKAKKLFEKGYEIILVREETSPEDVHGMFASNAILTSRGGMTSHAALVARGWGKCCIVGCTALKINYKKNYCIINNQRFNELDWLTLNGTTGKIYSKRLNLSTPNITENKSFKQLINICKKIKKLKVRANADSAQDAKKAISLGAQGIGLCRTEHMFFNPERIKEVRKMILGITKKHRRDSIQQLLTFQTDDFYKIFKSMNPHPITIRLLDPPLHEFLPVDSMQINRVAKDLNITSKLVKEKIETLRELNPMLGHRGCRLGITNPEITKMQITAILTAANKLKNKNINCKPEIMVPLVGSLNEFINQKKIINTVAKKLNNNFQKKVSYSIGTMIELPRACIIADEIAKHADFISFGTNDLTQTTFGFSRDDIASFLPLYLEKNIIPQDPFMSLDINGVGALIRLAIKKAKKSNPKIKIGICGEHGGDPQSINFFHLNGFDYVSCSPYRIPIAYLSSAQSAI